MVVAGRWGHPMFFQPALGRWVAWEGWPGGHSIGWGGHGQKHAIMGNNRFEVSLGRMRLLALKMGGYTHHDFDAPWGGGWRKRSCQGLTRSLGVTTARNVILGGGVAPVRCPSPMVTAASGPSPWLFRRALVEYMA